MGHITNPIGMRLKRYGLWQLNWSVYFRQEFSSYFTAGLSLDKFLYSFTLLKGFFRRFFFFELKYFLYRSYLMVFVCLKFIRRKTFLKKFKLRRLKRFKIPKRKPKKRRVIKNTLKFKTFLKTFKRMKYNKNLLYLFSRKKYLQHLQNSFLNFGSSYGYIMIYILFFSMILFKYKQNLTFDFKKISLYNHKNFKFSTFNNSTCFNKYLLKQVELLKVENLKFLWLYKLIFLKSNVKFCLYLNNLIRSEIFIKILLNFLHKILDKDLMITILSNVFYIINNINNHIYFEFIRLQFTQLALNYKLFYRLNYLFYIVRNTSIDLYKHYFLLKLRKKKLFKYYVFKKRKKLKALRKEKHEWCQKSKTLFDFSLFFLQPYNLNRLKPQIKNFISLNKLISYFDFFKKSSTDNPNYYFLETFRVLNLVTKANLLSV
jgi:hypothetical protein